MLPHACDKQMSWKADSPNQEDYFVVLIDDVEPNGLRLLGVLAVQKGLELKNHSKSTC